MSEERLLLDDLFSKIALEGDLSDELDQVLRRVQLWIGETLQLPGITETSSLDDLLDANAAPERPPLDRRASRASATMWWNPPLFGHFPAGFTSSLFIGRAGAPLIWNDLCQHLDPTWRRPGGRDEIASTTSHSDIRGLLRAEPHDRAPS